MLLKAQHPRGRRERTDKDWWLSSRLGNREIVARYACRSRCKSQRPVISSAPAITIVIPTNAKCKMTSIGGIGPIARPVKTHPTPGTSNTHGSPSNNFMRPALCSPPTEIVGIYPARCYYPVNTAANPSGPLNERRKRAAPGEIHGRSVCQPGPGQPGPPTRLVGVCSSSSKLAIRVLDPNAAPCQPSREAAPIDRSI